MPPSINNQGHRLVEHRQAMSLLARSCPREPPERALLPLAVSLESCGSSLGLCHSRPLPALQPFTTFGVSRRNWRLPQGAPGLMGGRHETGVSPQSSRIWRAAWRFSSEN